MHRFFSILAWAAFIAGSVLAADFSPTSLDIGTATAGSTTKIDDASWDISGSGVDIWDYTDGFRYAYQSVSGDFSLVARVASIGNTDAWAKAGVMVRQSTAADSIQAMVVATSSNGIAFQRRTETGGVGYHSSGGGAAYPNSWVRLVRTGGKITAYKATDAGGRNFEPIGDPLVLNATDPVLVGLCVTAHNDGELCTAEFRNVKLTDLSGATLPNGWQTADVGSVGLAGGAAQENGIWTVSGSGSDIWSTEDSFRFAYMQKSGNFVLKARVASIEGTDPWAKAGVMLRQDTAAGSIHAMMLASAQQGFSFQSRAQTDGSATWTSGGETAYPYSWVRLVRMGGVITAYKTTDEAGTSFQQVGSPLTLNTTDPVLVGLAVTAHNNGKLCFAEFRDVSVTDIATGTGDGLAASYFGGEDLTQPALVTRVDSAVDFAWGQGAPDAAVPADYFSTRWTGQIQPQFSETYTFYVRSDDGARLWINGQLVVDHWWPQEATEWSGTIALMAGQKCDLRMEFFERTGDASARLSWSSLTTAKQVIPQAQLYSTGYTGVIGTGVTGRYFDSIKLGGNSISRTDKKVDFNWGQGSPDPGVGVDNFSARWTGHVQALYGESYTFSTVSDDGVRLWVNGQLVIDDWKWHPATERSGTITLQAGQKYDLMLEYFEDGGDASCRLSWQSASQAKEVIPQGFLYPTVSDTTVPTVPMNVASTFERTWLVVLGWSPATDNKAVAGYKVYRDGAFLGTTFTNEFRDPAVVAGTPYSYTVRAYDSSGNEGPLSAAVVVTPHTEAGEFTSSGQPIIPLNEGREWVGRTRINCPTKTPICCCCELGKWGWTCTDSACQDFWKWLLCDYSLVSPQMYLYVHFATDYEDARPGAGCASCGGGQGASKDLPCLQISRIHRYRDLSQQGSLGPGGFLNWDANLALYRNGGGGTIVVWDPKEATEFTMDDTGGGMYANTDERRVKDLRLYDSAGQPVADQAQAAKAVITGHTGRTHTFEIIRVETDPNTANRRGRLIQQADRNGNAINIAHAFPASATDEQLGYDRNRLWEIATVTDAYGQSASFTYKTQSVAGRRVIEQVNFPNGQHVTYQYENSGGGTGGYDIVGFSGAVHPDGTATTFTTAYDELAQALKVSIFDASAEGTHRKKAVWLSNSSWLDRSSGRLQGQNSGRLRMVANGADEVTYLDWDRIANGVDEIYFYVGGGSLHRSLVQGNKPLQAACAKTWRLGQNPDSYVWEVTESYQTDDNLRMGSKTDNLGRATTYQRDPQSGYTTRTDYPDTTYETTSYNQFQEPLQHRDRLGRIAEYTYDGNGNRLSRTVAVGTADEATWGFEYNARGQVTKEKDADYSATFTDVHVTDFVYDTSGYLTQRIESADATGGARGTTVHGYEPDGAHRLVQVTDPVGRIVEYAYDSRNRAQTVTYHTYPDFSTEVFTYGTGANANLLTQVKDRNNDLTRHYYDLAGRKSVTVSGLAGEGSYMPDAPVYAGQTYLAGTNQVLTSRTNAAYLDPADPSTWTKGEKTAHEYDYCLRHTKTTVWPNTAVNGGNGLSSLTAFDKARRTSDTTDAYGRRTFQVYDINDRVTRIVRETVPSGAGSVPDDLTQREAYLNGLARVLTPNAAYLVEETEYDSEGEVTARVDGRGIRATFAYDFQGRSIRQIEASGTTVEAKTESDFDAQGNRIRIRSPRHFTEAGGFVSEFAYNGRNLLASRTEAVGRPEAATESYTYYADGRIKDTTDARLNVWTTKWRKCCPVVVGQVDPLAKVDDSGTNKKATRISGTDYANLPTYSAVVKDLPATLTQDWWRNPTDADTLNEVTTKYDARQRPISRTAWLVPLSVENAWENPPVPGEGGVPAGNGLVTRWAYDDDLTDTQGLDATYSGFLSGLNLGADCDGSMVEETSPAGEKTLSIVDGLGRTVRTVRFTGSVETSIVADMVYDEMVDGLVQVKSIRYPNGLGGAGLIVTKAQSDGAGRTRKTIDAENNASNWGLDANGNLVSARDPNSVGFDAVFDERNRETTRTDTHGDRVAWRQFDANSNIVKTKDALDHETVLAFDGRDRKVSVTDRISGVTTFKFDKNSNLLEIKDADAAVANATQPTTVYRYDSRNLLVLETYRDDATETNYSADEADLNQFDANDRRSYSYDAARRLTKRTDQVSVPTGYAYDMANRLLTRSYPDSLNDTFVFDADGRLAVATSARYNNVVARNYDLAGRLSSEQLTIGGQAYNLSYGFDAANRKVSEGYPSGQSVARTYTDRDQLASVSFGGSAVVSSFIYDLGGRETSRALANGITQARTWRNDNLPATIAAQGVINLSYAWDANKRKTAETNTLFAGHNNNYSGYDDEDRLTGWQRGSGDAQSWALSKVGDWNSTVVNGVQEDRTHNAVHEILTATPPNPAAQLVHDVKGNLIKNSNGQMYGTLSNGQIISGWDNENRLTIARDANQNVLGTYAYDALGRRVSKTVGETTTVFINNADWQEIAEYQNGSLVQNYVYGTYIDEALAMVKADGTRYFYSTNDLYSTYALTDGAGTVVERYAFDPYGAVTVLDGNGTPRTVNESLYGNPWTFTGRRLDQETGLMYYRARMYSTELGRFISRDPIGDWEITVQFLSEKERGELEKVHAQSGTPIGFDYIDNLSLYTYVKGGPSMGVDPKGTIAPLAAAYLVAQVYIWGSAATDFIAACILCPACYECIQAKRADVQDAANRMSQNAFLAWLPGGQIPSQSCRKTCSDCGYRGISTVVFVVTGVVGKYLVVKMELLK